MAERLNAADEGRVAKAGMRDKLRREEELRDLLAVLSDPWGRRFIWRWLGEAGIYRTSLDHSGSTVYANEGRREFGLKLLAEIMEASPEHYLLMQKEAFDKDKKTEPV